jgi:hypothetical protein
MLRLRPEADLGPPSRSVGRDSGTELVVHAARTMWSRVVVDQASAS